MDTETIRIITEVIGTLLLIVTGTRAVKIMHVVKSLIYVIEQLSSVGGCDEKLGKSIKELCYYVSKDNNVAETLDTLVRDMGYKKSGTSVRYGHRTGNREG